MEKLKELSANKKIALICAAAALIGLILLIVYICSGGGSALNSRDGVAFVVAAAEEGEATGSGFFVGSPGAKAQYLVTNNHVIKDAKAVYVYFSAATNDYVMAKVEFADEDKDLAVLTLPEPTSKRHPLVLRLSDGVQPGEQVFALGFPAISATQSSYSSFDVEDITVTSGVISKKTSLAWADIDAYQVDVPIHAGNSGGPLVDKNGFVLGINTFGTKDTETVNFATLSDELVKLLKQHDIPYATVGYNAWLLWLGIVILIGGLGAGAYFLRFAPEADSVPQKSAGARDLHKKPAVKKRSSPVLRGLSGKFAGQRLELGGAGITIGRDPSRCQLIYESDAAGISSSHCTVYYEPSTGQFVLTDNGSSYGTFLNGGKKLEANKPVKLAPGDVFYLADGRERFAVGME